VPVDKVECLFDGFQMKANSRLTTDGKQDGERNFIRWFYSPIGNC